MRETYCFLCGCSDYPAVSTAKLFAEEFRDYSEYKQKKIIGYKPKPWNKALLEQIYNSTKAEQKQYTDKLKKLSTMTKWFSNGVMLLASGEVIKCKPNGYFEGIFLLASKSELQPTNDKNKYYAWDIGPAYLENEKLFPWNPSTYDHPPGIFMHSACYTYACKKTQTQITHSHIAYTVKSMNALRASRPALTAWQGQFFDYYRCVLDGGIDHLSAGSPAWRLTCNKAMSTLQMVSKYYSRTGPPVPTKFYSAGDFKLGMDGEIWKLHNGKWVKAKLTQTLDKSKIRGVYRKSVRLPCELSKRGYYLINDQLKVYE